MIKQRQDKIKQIINQYEEKIKNDPQDPEAWKSLGNAYYFNKNNNKAIDAYKQAIKIKPNFYEAFKNLGLAYNSNKQFN